MANRSYLYSVHDDAPLLRDLAEWNSTIPVAQLILISGNPRTCASQLWDYEPGDLAVEGDATQGKARLQRFLSWLRAQPLPKASQLAKDIDQTLALLEREDRRGASCYHLEAGEVFEMYCDGDEAILRANAKLVQDANRLAAELDWLIETPGATLADAQSWELTDLVDDGVADNVGLYFPGVLYFHFT